jgi:enoyl-CoA hydratase/carnithine racemase
MEHPHPALTNNLRALFFVRPEPFQIIFMQEIAQTVEIPGSAPGPVFAMLTDRRRPPTPRRNARAYNKPNFSLLPPRDSGKWVSQFPHRERPIDAANLLDATRVVMRRSGKSRSRARGIAMADDVLKVERHPNYVTLILNRPEKRNALNQILFEALDAELANIEKSPDIRAVILRGEGRAFCSGIDLREIGQIGAAGAPAPEKIFTRLQKLPIPTIAAVQGDTLTGGLVLALTCDLRIAAQGARLGMTPARIGYLPTFPIFRRFIEAVGPANTAEIMYLADPLDAARAREIGLVHKVVPDDQLAAAADAWAARIAGNAPLSVRAMKVSIQRVMSKAFDIDHKDIDELGNQVRTSNDAKEGVRAFLEKRKPVWKGE